jgi:imidazolonepropionase-like amidohydrolase
LGEAARREDRLWDRHAVPARGNVEALRIGTSQNCELFAMSGERNPYKEAKLGVIQENAWADVLLVNGDPTKDINVLKDFERNLLVIIKDGNIYKNTLS